MKVGPAKSDNRQMASAARTLRFPHRRSIGTLYVAPASQPEEWELLSQVRGLIVNPENHPIKWEWLEEARGSVSIPQDLKVKLKIAGKCSLSPLQELNPDDIHTLDLSRSEVTNISLSHLEQLTGLKVLELTATNVTDPGLVHLKKLPNLQGLGLSHCQISGEALVFLENLKQLRELWLSGADIHDHQLNYLANFKDLVQLGLSGTRITDEGLSKLACLKALTRLYLFNTAVTASGTENLRKHLPACRIKWKPHSVNEIDSDSDEGAFSFREEDFWSLIDLLDWDKLGNDDHVTEKVVSALSQRSEQEIRAFYDVMAAKLHNLDAECFAHHIGKDAYQGSPD